jgi:hypothetical protein
MSSTPPLDLEAVLEQAQQLREEASDDQHTARDHAKMLAMAKEWWVMTEVNSLTGNFYPDDLVDEVRAELGAAAAEAERNRRRVLGDEAADREQFYRQPEGDS